MRGVTTGHRLPVHNTFSEVAEEVRARIANCVRRAPTLYLQNTSDDRASYEEQTAPTWTRKGFKYSRLHTADTMVLKRITLAHEVVYTSPGQPAIYEVMSSVLFINSYLTVIAEEPEEINSYMPWHLPELMEIL